MNFFRRTAAGDSSVPPNSVREVASDNQLVYERPTMGQPHRPNPPSPPEDDDLPLGGATITNAVSRGVSDDDIALDVTFGGWSEFSMNAASSTAGDVINGNTNISSMGSGIWRVARNKKRDIKLRKRRIVLWQTEENSAMGGGDTVSIEDGPGLPLPKNPAIVRQRSIVLLCFLSAVAIFIILATAASNLYGREGKRQLAKLLPDTVYQIKKPLPCTFHKFCRREELYIDELLGGVSRIGNISGEDGMACKNFYGMVCDRWLMFHPKYASYADEIQYQLMDTIVTRALRLHSQQRIKRRRRQESSNETYEGDSLELYANEVFFEACMRDRRDDRQSTGLARKILAEHHLHGWPYTTTDLSVFQLLRIASEIAIDTGLDTLFEVKHKASSKTFIIDEPSLLIRFEDLDAPPEWERSIDALHEVVHEMFFYFAQNLDNVFVVQEQIGLTALILAHAGTRKVDRAFFSFRQQSISFEHSVLLELYMRNYFPNLTDELVRNATILLRNPAMYRAVEFLFSHLNLTHVANYLGFRLLLHLSPYIFDTSNSIVQYRLLQTTGIEQRIWLKAEICVRLAEELFPMYYLYDYYASLSSSFWSNITKMMQLVKKHVLNKAPACWQFDTPDRQRIEKTLKDTAIHLFLPEWLFDELKFSDYDSLLMPSDVDTTHIEMAFEVQRKKHRTLQFVTEDKQFAEVWYGSVFNRDPWYDSSQRILYVPMSLLNASLASEPAAIHIATATIIWNIVFALTPVMEPNDNWSNGTRANFEKFMSCALKRYSPSLLPEHSATMATLHTIFAQEVATRWMESSLQVLGRLAGFFPLDQEGNFEQRHMLYLYSTLSRCNVGRYANVGNAISIRDATNTALMSSSLFRTAWNCPQPVCT